MIIYYTTGYVVPDTCIAESCHMESPLRESQLPPNLLLILIHASAAGYKRREAIRATWAKEITNKDTSPIQYRYIL